MAGFGITGAEPLDFTTKRLGTERLVYPKQNPRFLSHKTKPSGQKHKM
jgi:hypothetical protein